MKTITAGIIISLALALTPAPKITVQNPKLLLAAALYKAAVGDNDSALRLIQRAERARQSTRPLPSASWQTVGGRPADLFTVL